MGTCLSTTKVSGANSNNTATTTTNVHHNRKRATKPQSTTAAATATTTTTTTTNQKEQGSQNHHHHANKTQNQRNSQQLKAKEKTGSRRPGGVIPCGKRTDFGYAKDFDKRYAIGKLLGHGQFGYTYVATDKVNGDRVAVKRIEKSKMVLPIAVEDV